MERTSKTVMLNFDLEQHTYSLIIKNSLYFCIVQNYLKHKYRTNPGLA